MSVESSGKGTADVSIDFVPGNGGQAARAPANGDLRVLCRIVEVKDGQFAGGVIRLQQAAGLVEAGMDIDDPSAGTPFAAPVQAVKSGQIVNIQRTSNETSMAASGRPARIAVQSGQAPAARRQREYPRARPNDIAVEMPIEADDVPHSLKGPSRILTPGAFHGSVRPFFQ